MEMHFQTWVLFYPNLWCAGYNYAEHLYYMLCYREIFQRYNKGITLSSRAFSVVIGIHGTMCCVAVTPSSYNYGR